MNRRAFTWIELLAVLAILAILLAIFVPYALSLRENANRVLCADHLYQLRTALEDYASDNQHDYPQTIYDPLVRRQGYVAFTGPDDDNPFRPFPTTHPSSRPASEPVVYPPDAVQPSDVTASLWLLVREGYITDSRLFLCPSAGGTAESVGRAKQRSNFGGLENLGYSYASPFSAYEGYHFTSDALSGGFALLADINPGTAATIAWDATPTGLARANSPNHGGAGQNVLFADGSVWFETTPYCGVGHDADRHTYGDNIYTAYSTTPSPAGTNPDGPVNGFSGRAYGPANQHDSYLVPMVGDGR